MIAGLIACFWVGIALIGALSASLMCLMITKAWGSR